MKSLVGQVLKARYRVDEFVGSGGMADVYKVWDLQRSTYLAMKMLPEDMSEDEVFLRRFKREAQALARLQHPSIVRFYSLEQEGARAFILMDFIDGSSLRREIAQSNNAFSPQRIMEYMSAICPALHFAHSEGYIHCDIKPANILLRQNGQILLTDFGISHNTESTATMTMVEAGTPAYMSPEQVQGESPTARSDIYALGIVLFEVLTGGQRPFMGEHALTSGTLSQKVRWEQVHQQPPSPQIYNPNLSPAVAQVVLKCLAKNPAERFSTPIELLNALAAAFGQPVQYAEARPLPAPQPLPSSVNTVGQTTVRPSAPVMWTGAAVIGVAILVWILTMNRGTGQLPVITATASAFVAVNTPSLAQTAVPTVTEAPTPAPSPTSVPVVTIPPVNISNAVPPACTSTGETWESPKDQADMVCVPAGTFYMGSTLNMDSAAAPDEQPYHAVNLSAFWIDMYEVTNQQYALCVKDGGCSRPMSDKSADPVFFGNPIYDHYPVTYVDWDQANTYCDWARRRLPTEAEWEKAARGPESWVYPWGNYPPTSGLLNFMRNSNGLTPVGTYPEGKSFYGAMDMAGNAMEWVWDFYQKDYYQTKNVWVNPTGPSFGQEGITKGGAWVSPTTTRVRSAARYGYDRAVRQGANGFRCVVSAP
jgi:serine/threonine protein kinase